MIKNPQKINQAKPACIRLGARTCSILPEYAHSDGQKAIWASQCSKAISMQYGITLHAKGIYHPSARIMELRIRGPLVTTSLVTTVDSDGYSHVRVAMYSLEAKNA